MAEDKTRPRKQRHTAKRIFERLCDECGFDGGYTIVKDYVRSSKRGSREMFVPLSHPPGHGQADFGEALVAIGAIEQKAHVFALDLPHSDACSIRAYPAANTEAWLVGHVHAFSFFGAVPRSVLYDNDRCLIAKILPDGTRKRTQRFSAMLSLYVIGDRHGRPGKRNDKGKVEGLVGYGRRNFMVPMPCFADWNAFNDYLEEQCRKRQGDILRGHKISIGERLAFDLVAMRDLPPAPFDACVCKAVRSRQHPKCATVAAITQCLLPMATVRFGLRVSWVVWWSFAQLRLSLSILAPMTRVTWCLTRCITCA